MEFRQLRYFVAAAELNNIAQAAEKLHVSQPPVSRQIRALEYELGMDLFERTTKGVRLTEAGTRFLKDARRILADTDAAKARAQAAHRGEIGTLNVAFYGSAIYRAVPIALKALKTAQPQVSVTLRRAEKPQQLDGLRRGSIDIGFGRYYGSDPNMTVETVAREPFFVALSEEDPAADAESLSPEQLIEHPLLIFPGHGRPNFADQVITMLSDHGLTPEIGGVAEDATTALAMLVHNNARCLMPASATFLRLPGIRFLPFVGTDATVPVNCIFRTAAISPVLGLFLETLRGVSFGPRWYTDGE